MAEQERWAWRYLTMMINILVAICGRLLLLLAAAMSALLVLGRGFAE